MEKQSRLLSAEEKFHSSVQELLERANIRGTCLADIAKLSPIVLGCIATEVSVYLAATKSFVDFRGNGVLLISYANDMYEAYASLMKTSTDALQTTEAVLKLCKFAEEKEPTLLNWPTRAYWTSLIEGDLARMRAKVNK